MPSPCAVLTLVVCHTVACHITAFVGRNVVPDIDTKSTTAPRQEMGWDVTESATTQKGHCGGHGVGILRELQGIENCSLY